MFSKLKRFFTTDSNSHDFLLVALGFWTHFPFTMSFWRFLLLRCGSCNCPREQIFVPMFLKALTETKKRENLKIFFCCSSYGSPLNIFKWKGLFLKGKDQGLGSNWLIVALGPDFAALPRSRSDSVAFTTSNWWFCPDFLMQKYFYSCFVLIGEDSWDHKALPKSVGGFFLLSDGLYSQRGK